MTVLLVSLNPSVFVETDIVHRSTEDSHISASHSEEPAIFHTLHSSIKEWKSSAIGIEINDVVEVLLPSLVIHEVLAIHCGNLNLGLNIIELEILLDGL